MSTIDPDDPRPPRRQLADLLRAAILTGKLKPGEKLPSGPELAERYGVSKVTAQQAVSEVRTEGLVFSRPGSGVFVRERTSKPVGLRPHLERAFTAPKVTVDFAGFAAETLHGAMSEPLDKIRDGRFRPESIDVRILVPDPGTPWALPARASDLADSPAFRKRMERIMERHAFGIHDEVLELKRIGLINSASVQIRVYPATPLFKLYIINQVDAFFGFYPIEQHELPLDGEDTVMLDLVGKNAMLFHLESDQDEESFKSQFLDQCQRWYESVWKIGRELQP
ncbi:winged helix-turn-helix domain-containing protein [Nocardia brasiliensis]|uniref:winged helix-turn-helix domain-containing protein n=1 Tax=Nocardia brasiliensis TaxID=37326 RepID=UPI001893E6B8|nr:winged helix-turn-helix domain-containing protein [Nocardia brasiliensis]MBF6548875.1 winged helix-turn-helix transcriptional regulator [Nocardia brasiliensis]